MCPGFCGARRQYVEAEYPAAASLDVTSALIEAAEKLGKKFRVRYTACTDGFCVAKTAQEREAVCLQMLTVWLNASEDRMCSENCKERVVGEP